MPKASNEMMQQVNTKQPAQTQRKPYLGVRALPPEPAAKTGPDDNAKSALQHDSAHSDLSVEHVAILGYD